LFHVTKQSTFRAHVQKRDKTLREMFSSLK
jgi:hypothetical protein